MKAATLTLNVTGYRYAGLDRATEVAGHVNKAAETVVMVAAAPLIGLAFVVALPFAGFAYLAWLAGKALVENHKAVWKRARYVVLFFAAPFIGLAYAVALPFVGFGALVWMGLRAARERPAAA